MKWSLIKQGLGSDQSMQHASPPPHKQQLTHFRGVRIQYCPNENFYFFFVSETHKNRNMCPELGREYTELVVYHWILSAYKNKQKPRLIQSE